MNFKSIFLFVLLIVFLSCKSKSYLYKIEGDRITISDSLQADGSIEAYIQPYREHVNKNLDSVIAYSVNTYSKSHGELNTAIGNFLADMVYEQSNPIFKKRTGKDIDFVLINHGGIRAIISKGNVTTRTAFEVMPFENAIVVAELKGIYVKELFDYLAAEKRAHPISKLKLVLDKDAEIASAAIKGLPFDIDKTYYVATNDYLYNGGDRMDFFKKSDNVYVLDYKIRNALIDYLHKIDTIQPVIDDRFIQLKK